MISKMLAISPSSFLCSDDSIDDTDVDVTDGPFDVEPLESESHLDLFEGLIDIKDFQEFHDTESKTQSLHINTNKSNMSDVEELENYLSGKNGENNVEIVSTSLEKPTNLHRKVGSVSPSSTCSVETVNTYPLSRDDSRCMSKNAIAARENRQKKKQYVSQLESSVVCLKQENSLLKNKTETMQSTIDKLETEVDYLKGIIANQSTISQLLGSIQKTPGIRFNTSFTLPSDKDVLNEKRNNAAQTISSSMRKRKLQSTNMVPDCGDRENTVHKRSTRSSSSKHVLPRLRVDSLVKGNVAKQVGSEGRSDVSAEIDNSIKCDASSCAAGICLHVSSGSVSLEFCSSCSKNASKVWKVQPYKNLAQRNTCMHETSSWFWSSSVANVGGRASILKRERNLKRKT